MTMMKMKSSVAGKTLVVTMFFLVVLASLLGSPCLCLSQSADGAAPTKTNDEKTSSPRILPRPEEKISPIRTEAIEQAAQEVEQRIEDIGEKASQIFGRWCGQDIFLGITWLSLIFCFLAVILVGLLDRLVHRWIERQIRLQSSPGKRFSWTVLVLEAFSKPLSLFIWVYGTFAALSLLLVQLPRTEIAHSLRSMAGTVADIGGSVATIWLAYRLVVLPDVRLKAWSGSRPNKIDQLLVGIAGKSLRIAIVLLGSIMVIQNVTGVHMGPLIASLGLGGLAIALAGKDSVANFFGTLTIIFDKPFQVGDQVAIDKFQGTVESVGFRSTRIRTEDGYLLSMPNSKIIDSPLTNMGRRPNIRWFTNIGIAYSTPPEKVRQAVEIIADILRDHEGMRTDLPPRVYFNAFKDWSLNITVLAWYHPPEWWDYQAWVQKTCVEILEKFQAEGIRFALPAQAVHLPSDEQRQSEVRMLKGEPSDMDK